jgi:hypothetical protein
VVGLSLLGVEEAADGGVADRSALRKPPTVVLLRRGRLLRRVVSAPSAGSSS